MKIGLKTFLTVWLGLACSGLAGYAAETNAPGGPPEGTFKDEREKASYAMGIYYASQATNVVKRQKMDIDLNVVKGAFDDVLSGRPLKLTDRQALEALRTYSTETQKKIAEKNKKDGEAFLESNKTKAGVQTKTVTLPNSKTAEMEYKVITEGTGAIPKSNDLVTVNYKGTLLDGQEFDSSSKRGQPAKFMVTGVVKGWTEALEMMKVGSKWELWLPSDLAYGDMGRPPMIEPGATLHFEVELLSIEGPHPTPTAQPLTSDIIKVPSAEELKKGAKIEVIKPEEAARLAAQAQTNAPKAEKK